MNPYKAKTKPKILKFSKADKNVAPKDRETPSFYKGSATKKF
jgi:hypothetical protein